MKLEVLHIPDCPNLTPLMERLAEVTALPVTTRVIRTDAEGAADGMAGSPTLLIDDVDPFTATGDADCGVSCIPRPRRPDRLGTVCRAAARRDHRALQRIKRGPLTPLGGRARRVGSVPV